MIDGHDTDKVAQRSHREGGGQRIDAMSSEPESGSFDSSLPLGEYTDNGTVDFDNDSSVGPPCQFFPSMVGRTKHIILICPPRASGTSSGISSQASG